ncbi:MAG: DUF4381 domain-containing protein [Woeseiaceae bacterium]|nr:DUF4381 domain-containing protein [Woeseiaceae bacterium]
MDPSQIPIRDLHLPAEIGWWPLAPGWWGVIAIIIVLLLVLLRVALRHIAANSARRVALKQVEQARADYAQDQNIVKLAARLSELLRRTMLAYAPRKDVAGLTGRDWEAWLDTGLDQPLFTQGSGSELSRLPYRNPEGDFSDVNVDELIGAVRQRIRTPIRSVS